jgi:hypothetical protein
MQKFIISIFITSLFFLNAYGQQSATSLNSRLVGAWYGNGSNNDAIIFKSNGNLLYLKDNNSDIDNTVYDTTIGKWHTKENEIFLTVGKNKTEKKIYYFTKNDEHLQLWLCSYNSRNDWIEQGFFKKD